VIPAAARLRVPLAALDVASLLAVVPTVARADQHVVDHCRHVDPESRFVAFPEVKGATVDDCANGTGGLNARAASGQIAAGGGKFRWRYRFSRVAAGRTFAFRARVDSPLYPFAVGNSKAMFVRVR
jgi:hypothetical protein